MAKTPKAVSLLVDSWHNPGDAGSLSLARAAEVLGCSKELVDALVRKASVVPARGVRNRGGRMTVDAGHLWLLDAAVHLSDLNVPKSSIKRLVGALESHSNDKGTVLAAHLGKHRDEVVREADDATVASIAKAGGTLLLIEPRARQKELNHLMMQPTALRERGRPKVDPQWLREQLAASDILGPQSDEDEAAHPFEYVVKKLPWRE